MIGGWMVLLGLLIIIARQVPVTGPAQMSWPRATFFVMNAASLTGFDTTWAPAGQLTRAHTAIALLVIIVTAALSTVIATAAFVCVARLAWTWRKVCNVSVLFLAALMIAAFLLEIVARRNLPTAAWNACIVSTAGGMVAGESGASALVLWSGRFPLAFLAAMGPFVLLDTFCRRGGRPHSSVSRLTWMAVPISFVCALALVVGAAMLEMKAEAALAATIAATDARGAGFTDAAVQVSHPARWALVPVLLLGGASGGVGGGIKAITAAVLAIGLYRLLRGGRVGRTFAIAALLLTSFVLLFGATFLVLLQVQPQLRADRAAVLAAAACGNAGVSIDPVGATAADAYVLATAMLLGRALPWVFLWWSAARGDEPIAVG